MQLYIKQRVFAWGDKYDVYDASGAAKYYVESELFTFGHQIHVYEKRTGREVGFVSEQLFTWLKCFDITMSGREVGTVRRKFTFFIPEYEVDFMGWDVEGDFMHWDYAAYRRGQCVLSISKEFFTWGDAYTLDFPDPADEIPALLLAIAIDAANCDH